MISIVRITFRLLILQQIIILNLNAGSKRDIEKPKNFLALNVLIDKFQGLAKSKTLESKFKSLLFFSKSLVVLSDPKIVHRDQNARDFARLASRQMILKGKLLSAQAYDLCLEHPEITGGLIGLGVAGVISKTGGAAKDIATIGVAGGMASCLTAQELQKYRLSRRLSYNSGELNVQSQAIETAEKLTHARVIDLKKTQQDIGSAVSQMQRSGAIIATNISDQSAQDQNTGQKLDESVIVAKANGSAISGLSAKANRLYDQSRSLGDQIERTGGQVEFAGTKQTTNVLSLMAGLEQLQSDTSRSKQIAESLVANARVDLARADDLSKRSQATLAIADGCASAGQANLDLLRKSI